MGGMCLGSLLLPRFVSPRQHPLRVYALLELGIGVLGLVVLFGMPLVGGVYTAYAGARAAGHSAARRCVCAICLLPPTLLMGATLPAIARWVETTPTGVSWLGFFYGGNIAGAVFGCLLAGFYLLRVYDMATATYVAVAINVAVAAIGLGAGEARRRTGRRSQSTPRRPKREPRGRRLDAVYVAIALSGHVGAGRRGGLDAPAVADARRHGLHVLDHPGGVPGRAGDRQQRRVIRSRADRVRALALGWCQLLLAGGDRLDRVHDRASRCRTGRSIRRCRRARGSPSSSTCALAGRGVPGGVPVGRELPAGARGGRVGPGQDAGRLVGGVYAANTVGAIVGALVVQPGR